LSNYYYLTQLDGKFADAANGTGTYDQSAEFSSQYRFITVD